MKTYINKTKKRIIDFRIIFIISILFICIALLFFPIKKLTEINNERVALEGNFENKSDILQSIKIKLNDSIYNITLNPNESKLHTLLYRYGVNKVSISMFNSIPIINDTFSFITQLPNSIHFTINKSTIEPEEKDTTNLYIGKNGFNRLFRKTYKDKQLKFEMRTIYIE